MVETKRCPNIRGPQARHFRTRQVLAALRSALDGIATVGVYSGPDVTPGLARHPDRFPGFVATIPMNHPEEAVRECGHTLRAGVLRCGPRSVRLRHSL